MFGFKIPGTTSNNNNNNNVTGTGNSIFNAIGFTVPTGTTSSLLSSHQDKGAAAATAGAPPSSTSSTSTADGAGSDDLPPGWRLVSSRHSGRDYYLHIATGHTQWDKPTEAEPKKDANSGIGGGPPKANNMTNVFSVARMASMLTQANNRFQTTLQATKVGMSSANAATARPPTSRGHHDVDRDGQLLVEMFENERLDGPLRGSDPKKFSDRHASAGSGHDELPDGDLAEGHQWVTEWEIDQAYTAVDRDGWTYATDFTEIVRLLNEDLSHASRHPTDMVRRRRWIRYSHDRGSEPVQPPPMHAPASPNASRESGGRPSGSWSNDNEHVGSESSGFPEHDDDDDPFHRTAQKAQTGFRVNMKFPHRGGKDNTKDYQSLNLTDVMWLVNAADTVTAPTDEMMREKTANLEERIKEATSRSVEIEKELRAQHDKKAMEIAQQQKKLESLIAEYRKVQRENETLQLSVASHRATVEALRKEATDKDIMLNEEQRALNAEMAAANQALEEKAKALATARMRYKRDNKSLAQSLEDAKKRLEQQKAKAEMDAKDPLSTELKAEMEKVRQLHAKLEAVRQHRLALEEESKALFNQVVEKKADLKFQSKKKLETALKDVDEKIQHLKDEQAALTKKLAQGPDGEELRQLNARRNDIRSELGALKERRTMLVAEKRKQEGTD